VTPDESDDDRALAERVLVRRDEQAFRRLYHRHSGALYATALRLTSDAHEASDAVHDAWVRAVERLASFEWRGSFRAWMTGILINVVREGRRSHARDAPLDEEHVSPDAGTRDLLLAIDLDAAIGRLAPRYRDVFVLHDVDGFTHEEIGRMLGIDPGTSKSQLARARRRLREMLGERTQPHPSLDHSDGT
jgi:RNA polymerase sigma-70 factor (ECF subfamily)